MAAAAAPSEVLRSTHEKENFQRIARLLIAGGTRLLRAYFDSIHSPNSLTLKLHNPFFKKKLKGAKLTKPQRDCLYPTTGVCGTSTDFDISLLSKLLRTICNLAPPATGWDVLPSNTDYGLTAELVRIKVYRNQVCDHYSDMEISDKEFLSLWNSVSMALTGIAGFISHSAQYEWKEAIDKLLTDPLTPEAERNVEELKGWYDNDVYVTKALKELEISFQGGMESVQQKLKQTEESVVKQLKETIVKEISGASLQSPERVQRLEAQPSKLPDEQSVLSNTSSANTSGANQLSKARVQALEPSTQVRESSSKTTSTGSEFIYM